MIKNTEDKGSNHTVEFYLKRMWEKYLQINPDASRIHDLFTEINQGHVKNDHIALRTFNLPPVTLDSIAEPFLKAGYHAKDNYRFEKKKLKARHYEHENPELPKIFISELLVNELSEKAQEIIHSLVNQIPKDTVIDMYFSFQGRPWKVSSSDYQTLLAESEYAAWMSAFGYIPNHFTVSVNHLDKLPSIEKVNQFLSEHHFPLNSSGGLIKGSPDVYLEQSSTMASKVNTLFNDGVTLQIPGCFYEFAKRYPLPNGELYQGFVAASADKIFESTHANTA